MTKTRSKLSSEALLKLYHVLIQPRLFYCSEIWGYCSKSVLSPVTKIQKSAVRTICGLPYYSSTSLVFKELKILKFVDLLEFKLGTFMYKANNGSLPHKLQTLFTRNVADVYTTRQFNKLNVNFARTCIKANCPSILGVRLWNSLDKNISQCSSLSKFKKLMKQHFLNTYWK